MIARYVARDRERAGTARLVHDEPLAADQQRLPRSRRFVRRVAARARREPFDAFAERRCAPARDGVVEIQDGQRASRKDPPLRLREPLGRAHDLEVRVADVREDRDVGKRGARQRLDLAEVPRTDLDHERVDAGFEPEQQLRDAELVVLVGKRGRNVPIGSAFEQLRQQRFSRGFAHAPGDRRDLCVRTKARQPCEGEQREGRVRDDERGNPGRHHGRVGDDERRRPARRGLRGEVVSVERGAAQRDEHLAGFERARVGRDPKGRGEARA